MCDPLKPGGLIRETPAPYVRIDDLQTPSLDILGRRTRVDSLLLVLPRLPTLSFGSFLESVWTTGRPRLHG